MVTNDRWISAIGGTHAGVLSLVMTSRVPLGLIRGVANVVEAALSHGPRAAGPENSKIMSGRCAERQCHMYLRRTLDARRFCSEGGRRSKDQHVHEQLSSIVLAAHNLRATNS